MDNNKEEQYSALGIVGAIFMLLAFIPLFVNFFVDIIDIQILLVISLTLFGVAYICAIIDLIIGKKNKAFSYLVVTLQTIILIIVGAAFLILG